MTITETQRAIYLAALENDHGIGDVPALRAAGVEGTAGQLRRMIETDLDLRHDAWHARGWTDTPALTALAKVSVDTDHKFWNQANTRYLDMLGHTQKSRVELTGADGGPVAFDDRSATLNDVAGVLAAAGAIHGSTDGQPVLAAADGPVAEPPTV